jgi:hypothetical protein
MNNPSAPCARGSKAQSSGSRSRRILTGGLLILFAAGGLYWIFLGRYTREMRQDHGYYLWTCRKAPYQPKYLEAFARDHRFQKRFLGEAVDSLLGDFPALYGGPGYYPEAFSAINPGHTFPKLKPDALIQVYWLDSKQRGLTYCVLVVDGKICDFFYVER